MKVIALYAENFKKLRVVEIRPKGRITMITGKNSQGKTSVLDSLWFGLKGQKFLPMRPVRKGTERMKVQIETDEFVVTRTLAAGEGVLPTLHLEMVKGATRSETPQKFLDAVMNAITFDPLDFLHMKLEEQVAMLRQVAGVDLDFEELDKANDEDYKERGLLKKEAQGLEAQLKAMTVLEGLPKEKLDEEAILARLNQAGEANRRAQDVFRAKQELGGKVVAARGKWEENERLVEKQVDRIAELRRQLVLAEQAQQLAVEARTELVKLTAEAQAAYDAAPDGDPVDVNAITAELQSAQRTNRAIEARAQYDRLRAQLDHKREASDVLTRQMEARDEKKRLAVLDAKIPVEGLTFDAREVQYKGLPLANLGEGEQIRISLEIGMAANPKLRLMCIRNGEALDEEGLAMVAELAEKYDCDVWITKVDSSGKIGLVIEDGMIVAKNEAE